jgi:hypothetical protein
LQVQADGLREDAMATFEMDVGKSPSEMANPLADDGEVGGRSPKANITKGAPKHWGMRDERAKQVRPAVPGNVVIPESIIEGIFQDQLFDVLDESRGRDRTGKELWSILRVKLKMVVAADIYKALYQSAKEGKLEEDGEVEGEMNDMSTIYAEPEQNDWLEHMRSTEVECKNKRWFCHPNAPPRMWWDIGQVFMLAYVAVAVPIRAGFSIRVQVWSLSFWLDLLTDLYFLADIAVNFRTAYYDRRSGNLIIDNTKIRNRCPTPAGNIRVIKIPLKIALFWCLFLTGLLAGVGTSRLGSCWTLCLVYRSRITRCGSIAMWQHRRCPSLARAVCSQALCRQLGVC